MKALIVIGVTALLGFSLVSTGADNKSAPSLHPSTDLLLHTDTSMSAMQFNRQTNTFDYVLTITNKTRSTVAGPFTLAFTGLPAGVILANATGNSSEGTPILTLQNKSLAAGAKITTTLKFLNKTNQKFSPDFRLLRLLQPVPNLSQLQGPDKDGNGVRDDLDPMIITRYKSESERRAAKQVLKQMRNVLGSTGSVESAYDAFILLNKSFDCLDKAIGSERFMTEIDLLRDQMFNTRERIVAWKNFSNVLAGQSAPTFFKNPCEQ